MATTPADRFQQYVLSNLHYWRERLVAGSADLETLEQARNRIVTAIAFALETGEAWPLSGEIVEAFAPYMERAGYWETWQEILQQALAVAQQRRDDAEAARLSALLARLFQRRGDLKNTIQAYRRAIRLARRVGDHRNEARACSNLGYLFIEAEHGWRTEILCCHALTIFERLDNRSGLAHTENHLGILFTVQGSWTAARRRLERACALWQAGGDEHGLMRGYLNLALLYNEMEQPDRSLSYLERALRQARLTGEALDIAFVYINFAVAYNLKGEPERAETYAWQAETIFRRFSHAFGLALTGDNLGVACLAQEKYAEARQHLQKALETWRSLNHAYGQTRTLLYLVKYDLALGRRPAAAARLAEIERRLEPHQANKRYHNLRSLLARYRRSLADPGS